jgi:hypothetical protein
MEDHDRENSERTFAIRVSTSHFTVLVDQQASSKELRLNNFLMDVMYRSASRHQEAKQKKIEFPEMDCGDISDEVSEQVVYWMKNVSIENKKPESAEIDETEGELSLEVLSLIETSNRS